MDAEKKTEFAELLNVIGWSHAETGRRVDRSRDTIRRWADGSTAAPSAVIVWLRRIAQFHSLVMPIVTVARNLTTSDLLEIICWTPSDLAEQLNRSVPTVRDWVRKESTPEIVYRWLCDLAFYHQIALYGAGPITSSDAKKLSIIETRAAAERWLESVTLSKTEGRRDCCEAHSAKISAGS